MFWIWFLCAQLIRTHLPWLPLSTVHVLICHVTWQISQSPSCFTGFIQSFIPPDMICRLDSTNPVIGAHVWLGLVFPVTYLWDETYFEWFAIDLRLFKLVISNSWAVRWFFFEVISRRSRPKNGYIFNFGYILSFIAMCISLVSLESLLPHLFFFLPWSIEKLGFNSGCDWRTS